MRAAEGQSNFLTRESVQAMMTKTLPGALTGLGLFVPDENPNGYFEHSGANLGYAAEMCFQIIVLMGIPGGTNMYERRNVFYDYTCLLCIARLLQIK